MRGRGGAAVSEGAEICWEAVVGSLRGESAPDFLSMTQAGRVFVKLIADDQVPRDVVRARIFVLRSTMVEVLVPTIVAEFALRGIAVSLTAGEIGNFAVEVADPGSNAYVGGFDAVILWVDADSALPMINRSMNAGRIEQDVKEYLSLVERLTGAFAGTVVASTLAMPPAAIAPHFQANESGSARYSIEAANREIARLARRHANLAVWDVDRVQRELGHRGFWSPRDAATSMQPYSTAAILRLVRSLAEVYSMTIRAPKKVVVLDCDNTLWGGIIGEDGIDGISLGETYPGTIFERFHLQLRQLAEIGFVLALNSKNNESDVREVFDSHPRTVLRWNDFSAAKVNWQDKVANLQSIAMQLNVGVDSMVFLDDNDFELQHVSSALPVVTVVRIPHWPHEIPAVLAVESRLDRLRLTDEDRSKAQQYAEERERAGMRDAVGSYDEYLRRLEMVLRVEAFDPLSHTSRASQLTQKTNQFNLTTRRYSPSEIEEAARQGSRICLGSLRDRVGDYGRIALAIIGADGDVADLDIFLMSCRAIGRGVEARFLRWIIDDLRAENFRELRARFVPTARNAICRDFLDRNGFELVKETSDGTRCYRLILYETIPPLDSAIQLELPLP